MCGTCSTHAGSTSAYNVYRPRCIAACVYVISAFTVTTVQLHCIIVIH
jgi:hypothetical protein